MSPTVGDPFNSPTGDGTHEQTYNFQKVKKKLL
jgi:hypothetical protein